VCGKIPEADEKLKEMKNELEISLKESTELKQVFELAEICEIERKTDPFAGRKGGAGVDGKGKTHRKTTP
jgi:hypothetical protein